MELVILGTAAAEGWPAIWCACAACARARERGGKNVRTRTGFALGEEVKIDYGPDAYMQMLRAGLDFSRLRHLLITHTHDDHWYPHDLRYRTPRFCEMEPGQRLNIYGSSQAEQLLRDAIPDLEPYASEFHRIRPFEPMDLGEGIRAAGVKAAHAPEEDAFNYLLGVNGQWVLQGNDTGWYPPETWEFLSEFQLDVVVLDCTYGPISRRIGHLGIPDFLEFRDQLAKQGSLKSNARFIANHFSHLGGALHEELEDQLLPHGVEVAYDGMVVEIQRPMENGG